MIVLSNIEKLYDGTSADRSALHKKVDLLVDKGKIAALEPHDPQRQKGDGITYVDCQHLTVVPGLIDCHSHVTLLGTTPADYGRMNSLSAPYYIERILYTTLVDGGVTTVRDVGGATHFLKRLVDQGILLGPRLKVAICLLSTTGGVADYRGIDRCHGDASKLFPEIPGRPSSVVDGPDDCRKRVREIIACGADLVKFCASAGVISPSGAFDSRAFTLEEARAICDEAHARGVRVAAHAHSKSGIDLAIEAGADDLQHISFMDHALVEKAHKKGCTVTPTSWILSELGRSKAMPAAMQEKLALAGAAHRSAVEHAHKGGLKILMGTDPVAHGMHGKNYQELAHLIADGLPPLSAWFGATGLAAREIAQTDTGEIKAGRRADLLLCKGDVVERPELLGQGALWEVIKDGVGYRGTVPAFPQRSFSTTAREVLERAKDEVLS